jgi:hypothetical protein
MTFGGRFREIRVLIWPMSEEHLPKEQVRATDGRDRKSR